MGSSDGVTSIGIPIRRAKISYILDRAKVQSCIFSKGFKWEYKDGILRMLQVDIPAFCSAEFFTIA
mgnify:CR=1 FL=1